MPSGDRADVGGPWTHRQSRYPKRSVELRVPLKTVFTVALGGGLLWATWQLRFFLGMFALALVCAVTLAPVLRWLERRRLPHFAAVLCIALAVGGTGSSGCGSSSSRR